MATPAYQQAECAKCGTVTAHKAVAPEGPRPLGPVQLEWECAVCGTRRPAR